LHALTARIKKMADNKEFIIQIKGMQIGKHHYDFPIEGSFFKEFDNSLILDANLDAEVELEKGSGWINVTCSITGDVTVECDRCLEDLVIPMDFECTMAVKFAKSVENSDNDEFIIMDPTDGELDLTQFLYDYVCINLPLQKVHNEGECNPEMIAKLKNVSSGVQAKVVEDNSNSPFSALKQMLEKIESKK
ncbi:MAG: DUF177 domain-containing protein, partial [Bacteroidales bacterium]|nr:DUF177 domain-containing protein [Bacteroidales bacterium]